MTFEEAIAIKKTKQSPYVNGGINMFVYVVPNLNKDFDKFHEYYKVNKITDETSKLFCTDGNYSVFGLGARGGTYYHWEKLA